MKLYYDKRIIDKDIFRDGERTCECCKKKLKSGDIVEILEIDNNKLWFSEGHLTPYILKLQKEFLLSKI